jgi:hypothetical protein
MLCLYTVNKPEFCLTAGVIFKRCLVSAVVQCNHVRATHLSTTNIGVKAGLVVN